MKPSQLAKSLRRIASKIEASKTPSRALVARDLRRVLANMGTAKLIKVFFQSTAHDDAEVMATFDGQPGPEDFTAALAEFQRLYPHKTVSEHEPENTGGMWRGDPNTWMLANTDP